MMAPETPSSDILKRLADVLRCPLCRSPFERRPTALHCKEKSDHIFAFERPYPVFAPDIDQGKYDEAYAARYAFLWAYGYEARHSGLVESLYRSVSALAGELLALVQRDSPVIIDCGCGTGRCIADASALTPSGCFVGVDASFAKLDLADRILRGSAPVEGELRDCGFDTRFKIRVRGLANVFLLQADALRLPVADAAADLFLCINLLDRVEGGPRSALLEARRALRAGGGLVLTTPMNWTTSEIWRDYPDADSLLALITECGFEVATWFDELSYREILDGRGSFEEFSTLVCSAVATA